MTPSFSYWLHHHIIRKSKGKGYWGWNENESFEAIEERLESMDMARDIPAERWRRHLKEPACVVGEHRQFHLSLEDFKVIALDVVGDDPSNMLECFLKSSICKSVIFMWRLLWCVTLIREGLFSTLSSTFFLSMLL